MAHITHRHFIDLIICELFTLAHWFNPFAWVLRRDLKLIHEYQADQAVLNKGIDATKYQLLVVKKAVGERRFAMANNFTQCPISKRLKMMNKNNFKRWMQIKLILFVPLGLLLLQAFSRPEIITKQEIRIPILSQQETSESWLQKWVNQQILQLKTPSQRTNPESKSQFKTNHKTGNPEFYLGNVLIAKRNVLVVLNNKVGKILFEGELTNHQELTEHIKSIWNGKHPFEKPLPDQKVLELPVIGKTKAPQIIVSYRHDIATPPNEIRKSIEAIGRAFFELREQKSKEYFSKAYLALNNQEKEAIDKLVPLNISYTEPKMVGSKKK